MLTTIQSGGEEEGRAICVNGKMYDVVKIKHTGRNKLILCISDDKEDAVLEQLSSVVKSSFEMPVIRTKETRHLCGRPFKTGFLKQPGLVLSDWKRRRII